MVCNISVNISAVVNASVLTVNVSASDNTKIWMSEYYANARPLWQNPVLAISYIAYIAISILLGNAGNLAVLLRGMPISLRKEHFVYSAACLFSLICSIWTISAIAVNRYVCICCNAVYTKIFSRRNVLLICVAIWFFSLSFEAPHICIWQGHFYDPKVLTCTFDRTANQNYNVVLVCVVLLPPVLMISFSYLSIWCHVWSNQKVLLAMSDRTTGSHMRRAMRRSDIELAKSSLTVFIVFVICWTPSGIILVFDDNNDWPRYVYLLAMQLAYTNSSVNFIIYGKISMRFREGYGQLLHRLRNSGCRSPDILMQGISRLQNMEQQIDRFS